MNRTLKKANEFLMPNYGELGLEITSGKGAYVWTKNQNGKMKKCIDFLCGLAVINLGHCHPAVVWAINQQIQKLMHVSNLYGTSPMAELAERLVKIAGGDASVFFCNDGTGANEAAGKLARMWAHEKFGPQKNIVVAMDGSFHGRTLFSVTMTGQPKMQEKFAPGVPGVKFVKFNDIDDLHRVIDHDVCAVIYETIQAEGGVNVMTPEFHQAIHELSKKFEFLKIVDEVQTGVCRTGPFFSFNNFQGSSNEPDIITMAKALGGGLPLGAMIALHGVGDYLVPGSHAATFGGNPVACAAGLAVMKVIEKENLESNVMYLGERMNAYLSALAEKYSDKIKEVRGSGLMFGVELPEGFLAGDVVSQMYEMGVLIGTAGPQVVRLMPPFIVTEEQLDTVLKKFEKVIKSL